MKRLSTLPFVAVCSNPIELHSQPADFPLCHISFINGCNGYQPGWISSWPSTTWNNKFACKASLNLLGCRPNSSYRVCNYSFLITTILEIHRFHNTVSSINIVV